MLSDASWTRRALREMSTEQLRAGMNAFTHPPRNRSAPQGDDVYGCFCYEAFGALWHFDVDRYPERVNLSWAYEIVGERGGDAFNNSSFKLECLRELAERGVAPEAAPQKAEVAA